MNIQDAEHVICTRDALQSFLASSAEIHTSRSNSDPTAGSVAETQLANASRPESIVTAIGASTILIECGGEHLQAFLDLLGDSAAIKMVACCTCVRSMLEPCAISVWLSDPTIDGRERIARAFAYRYSGMVQQLKFARCKQAPPQEIQTQEQRIADVEDVAIQLGYPRLVDRRGNRNGIGMTMPNTTTLITDILNEERLYRLISGVAHGLHWATIPLAFRTQHPPQGNLVHLEKTFSASGLLLVATGAINALGRALWNQTLLMGWDQAPLRALLEETYDSIDINDEFRFWR